MSQFVGCWAGPPKGQCDRDLAQIVSSLAEPLRVVGCPVEVLAGFI